MESLTINSQAEFDVLRDKNGNFKYAGDVVFTCHINAGNIKAGNIEAGNIEAGDIKAGDINALDIKAGDINALDISYYAACIAYHVFKCRTVTGRYFNAVAKCLDGEIEYVK